MFGSNVPRPEWAQTRGEIPGSRNWQADVPTDGRDSTNSAPEVPQVVRDADLSPAAHYFAARYVETQRAIVADLHACLAALPQARHALPERWQASVTTPLPDAGWSIRLDPPPGPVTVSAFLRPPTEQRPGWVIEVSNRTERVSFPVCSCGFATHFDTVTDAVNDAITAVLIECGKARKFEAPQFSKNVDAGC